MENWILVTGGSGYIGSRLIRNLLNKEKKVVSFDMHYSASFIKEFGNRVEIVEGNLLGVDIANTIEKFIPSEIIHLAGSKNRTNMFDEFIVANDVNYRGTLNLLQSSLPDVNLKHIIIMGTSEEYGSAHSPFTEETREMPNSAYGLSKLSSTRLALLFKSQFHLPVTVLRPSIAFGPDQGTDMFIPALISSLKLKKDFTMTKGEQLRDFVYIDDLIDAICIAAENESSIGEIINIASGASVKIKDVASFVSSMLGADEHLKLGAIPYRKFEIWEYCVSIEKAKRLLGWSPKYSVFDGLKMMLRQ